MHVDLEAARLLVLRAAWLKDQGAASIALEGACAKLAATEMAQRVVDRALQLHGGQGVLKGSTVERLYREVRALRIYEGTSEIQKLVIARSLLKESR
jgi:acyl-CoA dehydrogenase